MIGILGAMDIELQALLADMEEKESEQISGFEFFKGKLAGREVVIAKCGIGKVAAAVCAQTMTLLLICPSQRSLRFCPKIFP